MKKLLLLGILGCFCLSAQAAVQCVVYNPAKNQTWVGVGPTRAAAMAKAMGFCSNNSTFIKNCRPRGCTQI